ncbi:MAG: hypothetical protein A2746_01285 [Candidatus Yanofskybacteria bacterium RIFCSPHIGHO2_01_FULL_44_22]|uniref:Type II secretion system protein GspG C-terminal domain-containing protein n=1 Tax=Candidatus Yanofskybacteria bacterium RIFCSPHIGHO2_01_FULL_44_22 TaxID=1802669 RepID=A0A1F8EXA2_9BACT|nr:MAG: hypothetical protein A2746_01285 [Candidatus Yanofskybacteria bacterium RIFCSPHIGHO2_01_FULL_44_22]
MKNPLTMRVESSMGAVFIVLLAAFFVGLFFIALKNFRSDTEILDAQETRIKVVSATERFLMESWMKENQISFPEGKNLRYLIPQYPSRPWLK